MDAPAEHGPRGIKQVQQLRRQLGVEGIQAVEGFKAEIMRMRCATARRFPPCCRPGPSFPAACT